ncbi:zinc finger protein 425-like [Macrosteles quadrilineatus]|uniref:zinc finger protein 425-like n=1 Tax=Macrosteles quadrilineatus TaxID=74068 RepID=UPI0023E18D72|nr:zinc finger protein 425-like [Macrosteles quadrilineatus]
MLEEDLYMDHPRPEGKREVKRSRFLDPDQGWTEGPRRKRTVQMQSPDGVPNKGRGGALQCALCRCQVLPQLMSKHLVSFYHSNRVRSAPEIAGRLAMDHMGDIVRQAPFQCGPCSFYCNTMQTFLWHWGSKAHQLKDTQIEGYYCCPICRVEVVSSAQMYQHLLSSRHKESVAIINGSVPIVMQKKRIIECDVCHKLFGLNIKLRHHSKSTGHPQTNSSASDKHQEREACPQCPMVTSSRLSLQRHLAAAHKDAEGHFFCSVCDVNFKTAAEAKAHRSSTDHKDVMLAKQGDAELAKVCCHCYGIFAGINELKKHLKEEHPQMAYRCIKCGARFTLKQELARHAHVGCGGFVSPTSLTSQTAEAASVSAFQCTKCGFSSDSEAEFLLHTALHEGPVQDGDVRRYKVFLKSSLRKHLHSHTGERPYSCLLCNAEFSRKDVLENHVLGVHCLKRSGDSWQPQSERKKTFSCDVCGAAFYDKLTELAVNRQCFIVCAKKLPLQPLAVVILSTRPIYAIYAHFTIMIHLLYTPTPSCGHLVN